MVLKEQALTLEANITDLKYSTIAGAGVNLLMLPTDQQALLHWMQQQEAIGLPEIATYLGQDVPSIRPLLQALVAQGFIQETAPSLRAILAGDATGSQRRPLADEAAELSPANPLAVIISPSSDAITTAGTTFELIVTVFNRGDRSALVDVFIDETAQVVRQWCESPSERLALGTGQSSEIVFRLHVPLQTLPATYTYQVVIDSPDHYPEDTPLQYTQKLQVTPQFETLAKVTDPTFALVPATHSAQPTRLQSGATLEVKVQVYNRSDRVDRFRLTCPDLSREWFTVRYPDGLETPGLVTATDGLRLNPNSRGEILLYLTPPLDAAAGSYTPTLRLHSANNPELNLLDVLYFEVAPIYLLAVELHTQISKIRYLPALYTVRLTNVGNVKRNLIFNVRHVDEDDDQLYAFLWQPPHTPLQILPKQSLEVGLQVKPTRWWRRPWFGSGRVSSFIVTLDDRQRFPLPADPLRGTLVWKARPWWQLLLLLLVSIGGVALLAFLIWHFFFRSIAPSNVLEFAAEERSYQEEEGKPIRLQWQVSNPNRMGSLVLTARSQTDGTVVSSPVSYDFRQGIPNVLKSLCTTDRVVLTCRNVPSEARKAGNYVFDLQIFSREGVFGRRGIATASAKTDPIAIAPIAQPHITRYVASVNALRSPADATTLQPIANGDAATLPQAFILQSWQITHPSQIGELQMVGRDPDGAVNSKLRRFKFDQELPAALRPYCALSSQSLTCQNVPVPVATAGNYIFELAVLPKQGAGEPSATKKTDTLKIEPAAPRILSLQINGQDALPKYIVPLDRKSPVRTLTLAWTVEKGLGVKVELLPTPGSVPMQGAMPYPLVQQPGITMLTLQVTNGAGKQIRRTIEIQVIDPNAANPAPAPNSVIAPAAPTRVAAPLTSPPSANPPSPAPNAPDFPTQGSPAPVEVPSRFN